MTKEEHRAQDMSIPKCRCGNNLFLNRQETGIEECSICEVENKKKYYIAKEVYEEFCETRKTNIKWLDTQLL